MISNAVGGNGGQIDITAIRLYGFVQQNESDVSILRSNTTNDISASSEFGFNGVVTLNTPDLDPSQGLVELPTTLIDRSDQIAAGCDIGNSSDQSEFVVTGRGGLPPSSDSLAEASGVSVPWVMASDDAAIASFAPESSPSSSTLIEAQGVVMDTSGNMHFVAHQDILASSNLQAASSEFCQTARKL